MNLQEIFDFLTIAEGLKKLERYKGFVYWRDYPFPQRYESVADHSWRLALLVIVVEKKLHQKLNIDKALKMALVHDIPEIIAGDASPLGESGTGDDSHSFNEKIAKERFKRECQAAEKIFLPLGEDGQVFYDLWLECEEKNSFEAKVVKALDKIEALLQILSWTDGRMFKKHLDFTILYSERALGIDPFIDKLWKLLTDKLKDTFKEIEETEGE
ncbi:HD family hydrolase [Candidatus Uabimicrobium sp. HlEnr_7]|uniref:HD domain-containing protein n=1 Tax=Candidatus Uabimicrobium helgolandensis TaxID=3095367 RepID=UPI003558CA93